MRPCIESKPGLLLPGVHELELLLAVDACDEQRVTALLDRGEAPLSESLSPPTHGSDSPQAWVSRTFATS